MDECTYNTNDPQKDYLKNEEMSCFVERDILNGALVLERRVFHGGQWPQINKSCFLLAVPVFQFLVIKNLGLVPIRNHLKV
jgi:hypothetical protein